MAMRQRTCLLLAGVGGFTAVGIGAFAAHGLREIVSPDLLATFEIGVRYHAYHALALLGLAAVVERLGKPGGVAAWSFAAGVAIFSGSLYLLALTGQRWLGAITPIGGVLFLIGWIAVFVGAWRLRDDAR